MRSVDEHLQAVLDTVPVGAPVDVPLTEALGCVLAEEVRAETPLPAFDNSAMDGYAVRAADVAGASVADPAVLPVIADLPAGSAAEPVVGPGQAARIMTGAPVPTGADAVVPVEDTDGGTGVVRIHAAARAVGAHIRRAGEDVAPGDVVLPPGALLGARHVAAAAAVGRGTLRVHPRPRVAVLSTGSELVIPGTPPRRGQIPDSNSYLLAAAVSEAGGRVRRVGAVPDDPAALGEVLGRLAGEVDLVVTSGGVSVGAYDVVKQVLGGSSTMEFVRVAMQPGKPQGLGTVDGAPIIAVPGNPVSAFVSFEVFIRPALRRMRGLTDLFRPTMEAVAGEGWRCPRGRQQYMPVRMEVGTAVVVRPAARHGSGSHLVAGLAGATGLAVVPASVDHVEEGDAVTVVVIDP